MATPPRKPRVFDISDPALRPEPGDELKPAAEIENQSREPSRPRRGWITLFISATVSLVVLASGLWLARFVSIALERQDAIGWVAAILLAVMLFALAALILRELVGWMRLARLGDIRASSELALVTGAVTDQRRAARRVAGLFSGRAELAWALSRLRDHERDVHDAGDLLTLVERDLMTPLDAQATRAILSGAKRVSIVTAISPSAFLSVAFVLYENLRLLRTVAGVYGGRPGPLGGFRLLRMVVGHLVASGGIALTDDLFGQFLGQDALRRVSSRLGEGAFNGALTARLGVAAIHVCRPLPFRALPPVRVRSLLAAIWRHQSPDEQKHTATQA